MFVTAFTPWRTITNTMVASGGEQYIFIQQHKGMSVNVKFMLPNQARSTHWLKHVTHNAQPETNIEVVLTVNSAHLFNNIIVHH